MSGETGLAGFIGTLTDGLSATNLWGAIAPIGALIVIVTIVAIGRKVLNKNLNSTKNGKAGKV